MRRETQNLVLLLVGVSAVMITVTGNYTRYVKPGLLGWLVAAAAVLLILALAAMIRDIRQGPQHHQHHHDDGHLGGHSHRGRVIWLLVVPIVLLIFIAPPPLSPQAAAPVAVTSGKVIRRPFPALPAGRAPTVPLPQVLMRIATDSTDGLHDRLITVTGFTMKDGDHVDLAKIVIICCAADAQLARLSLAGPAARAADTLPDNTWVSVEGTVPPGQHYSGTASIPVLEVSSVVPITPPSNPYGS